MARMTLAVVVAAAMILLGGSPSTAAAPPASVVGAMLYRYIPGEVTENPFVTSEVHISQGGSLVFVNTDPSAPHSLTGQLRQDGVTPMFDSGHPTDSGEADVVAGVETLSPGSYVFMCKLHGTLMRGLLVVEPAA